ncbi:MAG TPA: hypothetical protein VLY24_29575 [Bryobacteraceae bacterium]|nr:hypothetical protein [Bryobacteraceae bacterium]
MAEPGPPTETAVETAPATGPARSSDEVALELMKFIAVSTGYGRATYSSTGFSGKPVVRSSEEQVDALLELFERCRRAVKKDS